MDSMFDKLIALALEQELTGWDFTWLDSRSTDDPLPWDYESIARSRMESAQAVLDVDTGGGEVFSRLGPFPTVAWATEGYLPNVAISREKLIPLGIQVADTSEIPGILPFVDDTFDLVLNRHGDVLARETARVLLPGGRFLSQQVGGENCLDLNRALQEEVSYIYSDGTLAKVTGELEEAGLQILDAREAFPNRIFYDIASVVFYLKAIPWQINDFSVEKYREPLLRIHEKINREGSFAVRQHRLLVEALKPADD